VAGALRPRFPAKPGLEFTLKDGRKGMIGASFQLGD
jgi:hypothetical protein